jgi:hypothetical protein
VECSGWDRSWRGYGNFGWRRHVNSSTGWSWETGLGQRAVFTNEAGQILAFALFVNKYGKQQRISFSNAAIRWEYGKCSSDGSVFMMCIQPHKWGLWVEDQCYWETKIFSNASLAVLVLCGICNERNSWVFQHTVALPTRLRKKTTTGGAWGLELLFFL